MRRSLLFVSRSLASALVGVLGAACGDNAPATTGTSSSGSGTGAARVDTTMFSKIPIALASRPAARRTSESA